MKKKHIFIIIMLLSASGGITRIYYDHIPDLVSLDFYSQYPTYQEALDDKAIHRGWVPEWMPKSATDIEESYNFDINTSWVRFSVPTEEIALMVKGLTTVELNAVEFPDQRATQKRSWWAKDLLPDVETRKSYLYYRVVDVYTMGKSKEQLEDVQFAAVDVAGGVVWHWSP